MRAAVLDVDQNHNLRLKQAFKDAEKVELIFCTTLDELLQILNGQPDLADKIARLEKTLVDGAAMFNRASDGIQKAMKLADEKRALIAQMKAIAQAEARLKLESEVEALSAKIASAQDLKKKIEAAMGTRKKEIEALAQGKPSEEKKKIDLVLVDRAFLGNIPSDWNVELRDKITFAENKEVPVIAMGYNEDLTYIKNTLHGGVANYFVKPVDQLLLQQTLKTGAKVFELQTQTPIRVLKTATIYKMSEFEIDVECDSQFQVHELVEFYVDIFSGEKDKRVLARCESSAPKEGAASVYQTHFIIVGHTAHTMTEMRKWIRARYVSAKKNEEG